MTDKQKLITIEDAYDYYLLHHRASGNSARTVDFYERRLPPFFAYFNYYHISDITAQDIRQYLSDARDRKLAPHTIHGHARAIRAFCNFLVDEGMTDINPFDTVKMPRLPKDVLPAFTAQELDALRKATQTARERMIILLLLDTGVRADEAVSLQVSSIDVQSGEILVIRGKGSKSRPVFVGIQTRKAIKRYMIEWKPEANLLLNRHGTRPLTRSGLSQLLKRIGARASVSPCTPHMFRRTYALNMLRNGCDIYRLQRLMGHEDLATLRRYLAWVKDDLKDASIKYGVVDNL